MKNLKWAVIHWCLINLQEMAHDQTDETIADDLYVTVIIPYLFHAFGVN